MQLVPGLSFRYVPSTSLSSISTPKVDVIPLKQAYVQKFQILDICNGFHTTIAASSLPKRHTDATFELKIDEFPSKIHLSCFSMQSSPKQIDKLKILANANEEQQVPNLDMLDREIQRRKKIGLANRGRTPWNKGRTHSKETRELISKRTIEAMSDPKVRKKISEYPHSHSAQSKARISSSLRRIWKERLQQKRLQERCYLMWAKNIAQAAKEGFPDQEELEWDSYEKIKSEISSQHLQQKAEKARAKEIAKLKAEKAAKIRAEKKERLAQLRKEKEEKAKAREMKALARKRKLEEMKMKMALSKGFKLKSRLTKFHHNKGTMGSSVKEVAVEPQPTIDRLDINLVKMEKIRRGVSLADQIQAVKNIRGELGSNKYLASMFPISSSEVEDP